MSGCCDVGRDELLLRVASRQHARHGVRRERSDTRGVAEPVAGAGQPGEVRVDPLVDLALRVEQRHERELVEQHHHDRGCRVRLPGRHRWRIRPPRDAPGHRSARRGRRAGRTPAVLGSGTSRSSGSPSLRAYSHRAPTATATATSTSNGPRRSDNFLAACRAVRAISAPATTAWATRPGRRGDESDPADREPQQHRRYDDDEHGVDDDLEPAHPVEDERLRAASR